MQVGEEAVLKASLMRPGDLIKVAVGLAKLVGLGYNTDRRTRRETDKMTPTLTRGDRI